MDTIKKYCSSCGNFLESESIFCGFCGVKIKNSTDSLNYKKEDKKEDYLNGLDTAVRILPSLGKFRITSLREFIIAIFLVLHLFSFILSFLTPIITPSQVLFSLIIYAPVLYFIYLGSRWATSLLMSLWTLDQIAMIIFGIANETLNPYGFLVRFILWFSVIKILKQNFDAENLKRKNQELKYRGVLEETPKERYEREIRDAAPLFLSIAIFVVLAILFFMFSQKGSFSSDKEVTLPVTVSRQKKQEEISISAFNKEFFLTDKQPLKQAGEAWALFFSEREKITEVSDSLNLFFLFK